MNRRSFLDAVISAVVAVSWGRSIQRPPVIANYRRAYTIEYDHYVHRFDVLADGNVYCVTGRSLEERLTPEQVQDMLDTVSKHLGEEVTAPVELA